jgi:cytochrome c peroxidase
MNLRATFLHPAFILTGALLGFWSCSQPPAETEEEAPARPIGQAIEIKAPLGLPPVPIPADNPPTAETIALGRRLYYDPILSKDGTVSCESCHQPDFGFADPRQFSIGVGGGTGDRQAPSVINSAYYPQQFWDGRAASLEDQAVGPMQNPVEMAHTLGDIEKALAADPSYIAMFEKAFGPGRVTADKAAKAIASFERTVLSGNSPFDRYLYGGDQSALSEQAKLGLEVFRSAEKGNCAVCHTIEENHALFSDGKYHNLGVGVGAGGTFKDPGRFKISGAETDTGAFKTPTLRNITQTAPYMHDGSLRTLKDVVDFYIGAGNSNPHRDKDLKELDHLTRQERDALVAFMESLTGEMPPNLGPPGAGSSDD